MRVEWWVGEDDLKTRTRTGGVNAINGFEFQKAYARLRVAWMLLGRHGIVEVRYEGAQDVDIRFGDGRQQFVQAKHYSADLSVDDLHEVMAGFARDVISAKARGCSDASLPLFRLVSTRTPSQPEGLEVFRKIRPAQHRRRIMNEIKPEYRNNLSNQEVLKCVNLAWKRTSFEVVLREDAIRDFYDQACWALAEFGVPFEHVHASLGRIDQLLRPTASLQLNDVSAVLVGLPKGHFAVAGGACQLLPCSWDLPDKTKANAAFLESGTSLPWAAAAYGLGVERSATPCIESQLKSLFEKGGMLLIEGGSGTGKSILAQRIAWDFHRRGTCIVLDVRSPDGMKDEHWSAINQLCCVSERPVLLVVDEVSRSDNFIEELVRHAGKRLCVLSTRQPGQELAAASANVDLRVVNLGALDKQEESGLYTLLGITTIPSGSRKSLTAFASAGQIFAFSLALQNGSLEQFSTKMVKPLRAHPAHLSGFIDLCTAGLFDQTIATSILMKRYPGFDFFWKNEHYENLVFLSSDGGFDRLGGVHSLVSREVLKLLAVPVVKNAIALCEVCDGNVREERLFALRLLSNCVKDRTLNPQCLYLKDDIAAVLGDFMVSASYSDLHRMHYLLQALGKTKMAGECLALAAGDRIRESRDISLALTTQESFTMFFQDILALYEADAIELGPGKLLKATRLFGTVQQMVQLVDYTAGWLRTHRFPGEETRLLFEMGLSTPVPVGMQVVLLLTEYVLAPEIPVDTALSAVKLLVRLECSEYLPAVKNRFMKDLLALNNWSDKQLTLAMNLAGLVKLWSDQPSQHKMCRHLMLIYTNSGTHPLQVAMLQRVLPLASVAHMSELGRMVDELVVGGATHETDLLQKQYTQRSVVLSLGNGGS